MAIKYDGNLWVLEIFKNAFEIRMGDLVGIFSETYSFECFLYDFWILIVFGDNLWAFGNFQKCI